MKSTIIFTFALAFICHFAAADIVSANAYPEEYEVYLLSSRVREAIYYLTQTKAQLASYVESHVAGIGNETRTTVSTVLATAGTNIYFPKTASHCKAELRSTIRGLTVTETENLNSCTRKSRETINLSLNRMDNVLWSLHYLDTEVQTIIKDCHSHKVQYCISKRTDKLASRLLTMEGATLNEMDQGFKKGENVITAVDTCCNKIRARVDKEIANILRIAYQCIQR